MLLIYLLSIYQLKKNITITYDQIGWRSNLRIENHDDGSFHSLEHLHPTLAHRSLGVILSPSGSASDRLQHSLKRAKEIKGKLQNSSLSQQAKWIAFNPVIDPYLTYPLMNTYFTSDMAIWINIIISPMLCFGPKHSLPKSSITWFHSVWWIGSPHSDP